MKFIAFLIAGIAIGPALFDVAKPVWLGVVSQLAIGLFLFIAGFEIRFLGFLRSKKFFGTVFVGSFILPAILCFFMFDRNLFLAVALSISALPVAIQILKEKNLFDTELAREAITVSSLCDVAAWVILAFLFPGESIAGWLIGHWVFFMFFAGMIVSQNFKMLHRFDEKISKLQSWILAPIFFVSLGWQLDLLNLFSLQTFVLIFIAAVLTKGIGTFVAARIGGKSNRDAFHLSTILNARGAMEIMAAHFAYRAGLIDGEIFAALICLGILTSIMAVPLIPRKAVGA